MSVKIMGLVWDLEIARDEKFVLLAYADHASHDGKNVFPSIALIAKKTGYSERSVQLITKNLVEHGYLVDDGHGPKGTNKWRIPVGGAEITPLPMGAKTTPVQNDAERGAESIPEGGEIAIAPEPSLTVKDPSLSENSQNENLQPVIESANKTVDFMLAAEANNPARKYDAIREEFERELGLNPLPWDGKNRAWGRLERFLFAEKQKDPDTIHRFAAKREEDGKFSKLPSNQKIYQDPDLLIAIWPQAFKKVEESGYRTL